MDRVRNLASAVAIGSGDRVHPGRSRSSFACHRAGVPRYSGSEWPPRSVIVVDSYQGAGVFQPPFGGPS
jgi:hypothetical protein